MAQMNLLTRYWLQFKILVKKDFILARRNWTWVALLTPIFLVFLLWIINFALKSSQHSQDNSLRYPPTTPMDALHEFHCKTIDSSCVMVAFAPQGNKLIYELMDELGKWNDIKIQGYNSEDDIVNYRLKNPDHLFSAVVFDVPNDTATIPAGSISYKVYYDNDYSDDAYPVMRAVDESLLSWTSGKFPHRANITTSIKNFPLVYKDYGNQSDAAASLGPLFFFFPPVILLFIFLYQLVQEKENLLRVGMNLMGLKGSMFWCSWFVTAQVYNVLMTLILIISGMIFQFEYFLNCNFFVNFFLFFLFGSAMISISFFLSTVIHKSSAASNVGMATLIIGFIIQLVLGNQFALYALFNNDAVMTVKIIRWILTILFPPFNFSKCYVDIATKASDVYDAAKDAYVPGPGFKWSDLYAKQVVQGFFSTLELPTTSTVMCYLLLQMVVYSVLTWYLDNVIPGPNGSPKPVYFFLTPRYWGFTGRRQRYDLSRLPLSPSSTDNDVEAERQRALRDDDSDIAVRMINLTKTYRSNPFMESPRDVKAVNGVYLTISNGECFCVLGHNGSGKTTMINTLNGLFYPTAGTAMIYDYDIMYDIDALRQVMGVCPQHDILWGELTAREHLQLFAEFKGVEPSQIEARIADSLKEVGLYDVRDDQSKTFSGGMKRRLSVAIASIGNPKLIFLDEPTTGLDPMSKRAVWELIQTMKKDRVIFLTTHSLEEADVLSDKIAIMSFGQVKCVGTPLHLKNKFGNGYRINMLVATEEVAQLKELIKDKLLDSELIAENAGNLTFKVPFNRIDDLSKFCAELERGEYPIVKDWGISQTTLEDVFLKVTEESHFTYAKPNPPPSLVYQQVPLDPQ